MNKTFFTSPSTSIETINRNIRSARLQDLGEPEGTLSGRLARMARVFGVIRPLLVLVTAFPLLPTAMRTALTVFVESLDALSVLAVSVDAHELGIQPATCSFVRCGMCSGARSTRPFIPSELCRASHLWSFCRLTTKRSASLVSVCRPVR